MTARRSLALALALAASLAGCDRRQTPGPPVETAQSGALVQKAPAALTQKAPDFQAPPAPPAVPAKGHPRLWVRASDLPKLRARATPANPIYGELFAIAAEAKAAMDQGKIPSDGECSFERVYCEGHAQLFAFMSLLASDEAARKDYAARARKILLHIVDQVNKAGPRDPFGRSFSTRDRSRWAGEAFGLTVDWIYGALSTEDKAAIRSVFLRWAEEQLRSSTTSHDHPEPIGKLNDPAMLKDPRKRRYAVNNYFTAHMRNLALMSLAFDAEDDPPDPKHQGTYPRLRDYIANVTGAWLYMTDSILRNDARGGAPPEGFEYGPATLSYVSQTLLALQTAGEADPAKWGPQVHLDGNPFWHEFVPAHLHSLSPATVPHRFGPTHEAAWTGDGERYWVTDHIDAYAALGLHAENSGNAERLNAMRWMAIHLGPGGPGALLARRARSRLGQAHKRHSILYFLLLDPAVTPADPRPSIPLAHFGPGLGKVFARTSWGPDATWINFHLGWAHIDHQHGDGLTFGFYRGGEWLTRERVGYGAFFMNSDQHNTLAVENDKNRRPDDPMRGEFWRRGSQWPLVHQDDPAVLAKSFAKDYVYVLGDATALYNSAYENVSDVTHVSRSLVWLMPDHLVIYDRAATGKEGRFKRFFLHTPTVASVAKHVSTVTTPKGQKLFVTTLLPDNAVITAEPYTPGKTWETKPAENETILATLRVEPPAPPKDARFLHVLQGAAGNATPDAAALVRTRQGKPFAGAVVKGTLVLFPVDLGAAPEVTYTAPPGVKRHLITGLTPGAAYDVIRKPGSGGEQISIRAGSAVKADEGGVLSF